jgi:ADP-heptose:LPS heptosyltransferase
LFTAPHGNGQQSGVVCSQLPDINGGGGNTPSTSSDYPTSMTVGKVTEAEKRTGEVTKNLISIYKRKRMQVFHTMAAAKTAMRSKEFFKIYLNPAASMIGKKKPAMYRTKFHKPKPKPLNYQMEYERLRGLRESEEELAKVQVYIDKMIQKNIKKYEDEKRQRQMAEKSIEQAASKASVKIATHIYFSHHPSNKFIFSSTTRDHC